MVRTVSHYQKDVGYYGPVQVQRDFTQKDEGKSQEEVGVACK